MEKKLHYSFDHKNRIIIERLKGKISFKEIMVYQKKILTDSDYNDSYSIFSDIRGAFFELSDIEIKTIYKLLKKATSKNSIYQKCAFITTNPNDVVNSEMIKINMKKFSPINIQIFSTKEAACQWLNINKLQSKEEKSYLEY